MKLFVFALLVFLVAVTVTEATPAKKVKAECAFVCPANYDPVCGADPNDKSVKPKSFGNKCVMDLYNCQNKANLVVVGEQQCQNSGGIRLQ